MSADRSDSGAEVVDWFPTTVPATYCPECAADDGTPHASGCLYGLREWIREAPPGHFSDYARAMIEHARYRIALEEAGEVWVP